MNENRPQHVAIVMDGNNRWAAQRGVDSIDGHRAGVKALRDVVKSCVRHDIPVLTVFAFSSENWSRPDEVVEALMGLFMESLETQLPELVTEGVQLRFIGDLTAFGGALRHKMLSARDQTSLNSRLVLNVAVNYGGRWEIVDVARKLMRASSEGNLVPEDLNEALFHHMTPLGELPQVDLFIRTGKELRVSNFLLWHLAYAEMVFSDVMWPDFNEEILLQAMAEFAKRQRRFGRMSVQVESEGTHQSSISSQKERGTPEVVV